jgi:ribosomal protein L7/L12
MPETFECPSCGAPLNHTPRDLLVIQCHYCRASVIVPESLRPNLAFSQLNMPDTGFGIGTLINQAEQIKQIVSIAQSGNKIEAIKRFRELTGSGLKEAKDAVEALMEGKPVTLSENLTMQSTPHDVSTDRIENIIAIAHAGNKIEAIKRYRELTGMGLKESKDAVEALLEGKPVNFISAQNDGTKPSNINLNTVKKVGAAGVAGCSVIGAFGIIFILLLIIVPILIALSTPGGPLFPFWSRINPTAFAHLDLEFGSEGTGNGLLDDARVIAIDPLGTILVGDYADGRIQRFDENGTFQSLWMIQEDAYLSSLFIDQNNVAYMVYRGDLWRYNSTTGDLLGKLDDPEDDPYFDYAAHTPDGDIIAAAGERLIRFEPDGQISWQIDQIITNATGDSDSISALALDGLGNIYTFTTFDESILKYSPEGKFITRWGSQGDEAGQFTALQSIAVDGYGRIYVSDFHGIQVFENDGRYIDKIATQGVVFGMTIHQNNILYTVTSYDKVSRYILPSPN